MAITIFIAGDVVPRKRTVSLFKERKADTLFGDMMSHIQKADISIVNFEAPIAEDSAKPISKSGPCLKTTVETLETLKIAGFDTVTLANNHFRDYGQNGVDSTIESCEALGIRYVGGGQNSISGKKDSLYSNVRRQNSCHQCL